MRVPVAATVLAALLVTLVPARVASAAAKPKVDEIVLGNGTRVIGELRSMSKGRLELKTDDMGTIQIEWGNVVQVTAPEYFEVEDMQGRLHFGALRPAPQGSVLEVVNTLGAEPLALGMVARIQLVEARFWARISGSLDAGVSFTSASELLQVNVDGDVLFRRPKFELSADAHAVASRQPEVDNTRRGSLTLSYRRIFSNGNRLIAQGMMETNRELGYDWRASFTGGWAKYLARNTRNELIGGAGLAVNHEVAIEGEETTNLEAAIGFSYANFAYDFPNTDIELNATTFLGLNQWGRFRLEASASLSREIFRDFYLGLKGYESFDSDPATEGATRNDWGATVSLGWRF
jgi:hypothetical protein